MKKLFALFLLAVLCIPGCFGCEDEKEKQGPSGGDPEAQKEIAYDASSDVDIQQRNLEEWKARAVNRFPGDTIELYEHILKSYEKGTYLMDCDRTVRYNIPNSAVIYQKQSDGMYVFAMIAKSKEDDERFIEKKNVIGYDASFIDLDSTELGTAFFYLTLFKYEGGFQKIWEAPVPTHGGFNRITLENWKVLRIPYIRINFHYAQGSGHIDYNYFLNNGLLNPPHLLMTYEGINMKRTMIDANRDSIPDYREYVFVDTGDRVITPDSVVFIWKDTAYFNERNKRQWKKY